MPNLDHKVIVNKTFYYELIVSQYNGHEFIKKLCEFIINKNDKYEQNEIVDLLQVNSGRF